MSAFIGGLTARQLIAAARAARKFIAQSRRTIFDSHVDRGGISSGTVTNPAAVDWLAEHDAVIAKLDAAIAKARAS